MSTTDTILLFIIGGSHIHHSIPYLLLIMALLPLIFLLFLAIKICFALYFYTRLAFHKVPDQQNLKGENEVEVSVVVCYHNESKHVYDSVSRLNKQSKKKLELVLVDDLSTDNTLELLKDHRTDHTKIVENNRKHSGKKLALSRGIAEAKNQWLLMTDADCQVPSEWAETMTRYTAKSRIVLGYAPLHKSGTWVGKFARYETYYTALQYLSFALAGHPYMGVGRNLMYHRSIFDMAGGFSSHTDLASGDDDLLINFAANTDNTTICLDPNSFVYSPGKENLTSFIRQKTRHISSSHRYQWRDKVLLGLSSLSQMGLYITAIVLLFSQYYAWLLLLLLYWLFMMLLQYPICKKLQSKDLWLALPIYDIAMALYYIIMIPFTFTKKQNSWS